MSNKLGPERKLPRVLLRAQGGRRSKVFRGLQPTNKQTNPRGWRLNFLLIPRGDWVGVNLVAKGSFLEEIGALFPGMTIHIFEFWRYRLEFRAPHIWMLEVFELCKKNSLHRWRTSRRSPDLAPPSPSTSKRHDFMMLPDFKILSPKFKYLSQNCQSMALNLNVRDII